VVCFVDAEHVWVYLPILVREQLQICKVLPNFAEFLFNFAHSLFYLKKLVCLRRLLEFFYYGFSDEVASVTFWNAQNHLFVDFFRDLHRHYSGFAQCAHAPSVEYVALIIS